MRSALGNRRGAVLIVVLGVLAILALLGVTFSTLQATEKRVSRNYLDMVRANLIAMSGVNEAIDRISSAIERGEFSDPSQTYWGNVLAETGVPDTKTPLETAKNPSFAYEDESTQNPLDSNRLPLILQIDGEDIGFSGLMSSGTYRPHGDIFRLRVSDSNSRIYVNGGIGQGPNSGVSQNLKRILNNLGSIVQAPGVGDKILSTRPEAGWSHTRELLGVLTNDEYDRIEPHVTAHAWVDGRVVNPVPLSEHTLGVYPVRYNEELGLYRYSRSKAADGSSISAPLVFAPEFADPAGSSHAAMALDELNAGLIERAARAPVNVNQASEEVLTALIIGVRGWFLLERRKYNPDNSSMYSFLNARPYDNTPLGDRGDEIGFLYSTAEFVGPGATVTNGISAQVVAREIIACRGREKSPETPSIDYGSLWYGGPFRSWAQFGAFCDGLVSSGILKDTRPIFFEYDSQPASDLRGSDSLVKSTLQAELASQALADVLKANFNPNCTLNELNPDANLYQLVDKTDLIANSTEFCFSPMGFFQIESHGLVLGPINGGDLLDNRNAQMIARKKIECVVKLFDVYRESTQADFYDGELSARTGRDPVTNNNRTLESGPEPDNGSAPSECGWSGWIQLATRGGHWSGTGQSHQPKSIEVTPPGSPERQSTMHAHFSLDHRLHHHAAGMRDPVPSTNFLINNPDRTEGAPGPYGPVQSYRLARDYTMDDSAVTRAHRAVGDLRIDGAYVERDSAVMYTNDLSTFGTVGTVAFWVKPSFHPSSTGKPRTFFSGDTVTKVKHPRHINGVWFFASHDQPSHRPSRTEGVLPSYRPGPWRPASILAGYSSTYDDSDPNNGDGGVGVTTDSLNHRTHSDQSKRDVLRHHGWTHVAYCWDMEKKRAFLLVNGNVQPLTSDIVVHPGAVKATDYTLQEYPLRLGEPSTTMELRGRMRNWTADATLDEFYMWKGNALVHAQELYRLGRYHCPTKSDKAAFTSRPMKLDYYVGRTLPPSAGISAPGSTGTGGGVVGTTRTNQRSVKLLNVAWTWYAERISPQGRRMVHDHNLGLDLEVEVDVSLLLDGAPIGSPVSDDEGSPLGGVSALDSQELKYKFEMSVPDSDVDTILLATPVIDDVTFFYSSGKRILTYYFDEFGS